jgi:hypothetical protein
MLPSSGPTFQPCRGRDTQTTTGPPPAGSSWAVHSSTPGSYSRADWMIRSRSSSRSMSSGRRKSSTLEVNRALSKASMPAARFSPKLAASATLQALNTLPSWSFRERS